MCILQKYVFYCIFFFSSRRRHTRCSRDWSSDVCSSDLTDAIAKAGINIDGYCAVPSGKDGKGTFRVITKDPATTKKALETAGFKVQEERDIAVIDIDDRPGALAQVLRRLAENELNVGPTYSITQNRVAISADDFAKLRETLQEVTSTARRR